MKLKLIYQWLTTIIILPGTAFVFVPGFLLYLFKDNQFHLGNLIPTFWIALVFAIAGLFIALWTMSLFFSFGNGTPAPWNPPKNFIVRGPYCYVRNPMMIGGFLILLSETLFFESGAIFIWLFFFIIVNFIYIPAFEEPGLERRFGDKYLEYKKHVPRWLPRLTPHFFSNNQ